MWPGICDVCWRTDAESVRSPQELYEEKSESQCQWAVHQREHEDQADRVGLRYVYEVGYDVDKAPALWKKFAEKYGDGNKVTNFFFGDHSLARQRAKNLQGEIARNYSNPAKDPPTSEAIARLGLPAPGAPLQRLQVLDQVAALLLGQDQPAGRDIVADDRRQVREAAVVVEPALRVRPQPAQR